ncbi:guanine deaminase isoform X2 [Xyrauchen texanus]|uniref:guanine deaminase isoform X2 n=1 Tax=Xyrauchen texanus TaxID=154827 RepID=UPI002242ADBB|nr:guanine deaminase isoform X2 [Xyrauchen texanus]
MSLNETTTRITHVFSGTFAHSTKSAAVEILQNCVLGVDDEGKVCWIRIFITIAFIEEEPDVVSLSKIWGFETAEIKQLEQHEFLMPGMVDTHIHASQYSYTGTALDLPLLQWLNNYTFPVEAKYKDLDFANNVYTKVVRRTLKNGTTTACYFATIHTDASLLLGELADKFGQRALVGKVCMDYNPVVPQYQESSNECIEETDRFITELLKKEYPNVKPVVTPRFAPSCSASLLSELGAIANNKLHIQSHISENKEEVELVKTLFPDCKSYTDVYLKHNLLTEKTVMAHGCHLTDEELKIFHERGSAISHCPNSNISICSGLLNVRNVLNHKVKLGLGTDVAGGYSPSILDAMRRCLDTSKALTIQDPQHQTLTFEEVFRLATLGGSEALSLDDQIGNFVVGKDFDALRVNVCVPGGPIDLFPGDGHKVILEKFLNLGDDRNITEVYVAGRQVVPFSDT